MSLLSPPKIPLFRITLFYGPEIFEGDSETIHCVFNVKKRSWKGGVQVDIVVGKCQIERLEQTLGIGAWIDDILRVVPSHDREDYSNRGFDLFSQFVCFHKLEMYIRQGIKQENTQVPASCLIEETEAAIQQETEKIKQQILIELDVEEFEDG